jgi:hypothetical protein
MEALQQLMCTGLFAVVANAMANNLDFEKELGFYGACVRTYRFEVEIQSSFANWVLVWFAALPELPKSW